MYKSQYLNCGIFVKTKTNVLYISILCIALFFGQAYGQLLSGNSEKSLEIDFPYDFLSLDFPPDSSQILELTGWEKGGLAIPAFLPGKKYRVVKYTLQSESEQNLIWVNTNVYLNRYDFYVVSEGKLIEACTGLSWRTRPEHRPHPSVYFACLLNLQKGMMYEVYLVSQSEVLPNRLVSRVFTKAALEKFEKRNGLIAGLAAGVLLFIFLLTLGIFLVFKVRLFLIYSFFTLTFCWIYFYITGLWFGVLPQFFFENGIVRVPSLLVYLYFFTNLWFARAFFKIDLESVLFFRVFYKVLFLVAALTGTGIVFYDVWLSKLSSSFISGYFLLMDFLAMFLNLFMLCCALFLIKKRPLARWYLVAVIPGILSVTGLRLLELAGVRIWYSLPLLYLCGMVWHALVLMTGFIYHMRAHLALVFKEPAGFDKAMARLPAAGILSARERDILMAFANGFSYTEISDAFLISPHTVRTHLKNIYGKLGINSKAEAVRWVLENMDDRRDTPLNGQ